MWSDGAWEGMGGGPGGTIFATQFFVSSFEEPLSVLEIPSSNTGREDLSAGVLEVIDMDAEDSAIYSVYFLDEVNSVTLMTRSDELCDVTSEVQETVVAIL